MSNTEGIQYSDYYVAFLDILGFKKLVKSESSIDKKKIFRYFQLIETITADLKKIDSKKNIGSIVISDSVILTVPMGDNWTEKNSNLRQLCIAIQKIQFGLAEQNIWLRGAVSCGKAFFNAEKNQVVGPAYIDAYLLQEQLAKYPRVILDNKIIKALNVGSSGNLIDQVNYSIKGEEYDILKNNVLFNWEKSNLKNDVALFVDYLVYGLVSKQKLESIVSNIEQNIYSDNIIFPKFRWITDYLLDLIAQKQSYLGENIDYKTLMEYHSRLKKL